jgi:hypothetical protein
MCKEDGAGRIGAQPKIYSNYLIFAPMAPYMGSDVWFSVEDYINRTESQQLTS